MKNQIKFQLVVSMRLTIGDHKMINYRWMIENNGERRKNLSEI